MSLPEEHTSATETTFLLPAKNKRSRTSFWTKKPTGKSSSLFLSKHHNNTGFIKENVGTCGAKFSSRWKQEIGNETYRWNLPCWKFREKALHHLHTKKMERHRHFSSNKPFSAETLFLHANRIHLVRWNWNTHVKRLRDPSRISLGGLKITREMAILHIRHKRYRGESQNIVTSVLYRCSFVCLRLTADMEPKLFPNPYYICCFVVVTCHR